MNPDDPLQLDLPLEPGPRADTPAPCRCCRGRRFNPAAWGWMGCTWCDESGIDPLPLDRPALRVLRQEDAGDVRRSA